MPLHVYLYWDWDSIVCWCLMKKTMDTPLAKLSAARIYDSCNQQPYRFLWNGKQARILLSRRMLMLDRIGTSSTVNIFGARMFSHLYHQLPCNLTFWKNTDRAQLILIQYCQEEVGGGIIIFYRIFFVYSIVWLISFIFKLTDCLTRLIFFSRLSSFVGNKGKISLGTGNVPTEKRLICTANLVTPCRPINFCNCVFVSFRHCYRRSWYGGDYAGMVALLSIKEKESEKIFIFNDNEGPSPHSLEQEPSHFCEQFLQKYTFGSLFEFWSREWKYLFWSSSFQLQGAWRSNPQFWSI